MTGVLDEVRFWSQVVGDAKRTIVCPPDLESRVKGYIDARGMSGILTVVANPYCPPETIMIIDEQAIAATLARPIRPRLS